MWPKILYDVSEYTALRERRMLLPERQARKALASLRKDLGGKCSWTTFPGSTTSSDPSTRTGAKGTG